MPSEQDSREIAATDPKLLVILEELKAREPIFHRPEFGTSRADFGRMVTEDFWEVGASGKQYTRQVVLDTLDERHKEPVPGTWETSDFRCQELGPGVYLLTYTLRQEPDRLTRRTTI